MDSYPAWSKYLRLVKPDFVTPPKLRNGPLSFSEYHRPGEQKRYIGFEIGFEDIDYGRISKKGDSFLDFGRISKRDESFLDLGRISKKDDGFLDLGRISKKDFGFLDLGRISKKDDGFLDLGRISKKDDGFLDFGRISKKDYGFLDIGRISKKDDGFLDFGRISKKDIDSENNLSRWISAPELAEYIRNNRYPQRNPLFKEILKTYNDSTHQRYPFFMFKRKGRSSAMAENGAIFPGAELCTRLKETQSHKFKFMFQRLWRLCRYHNSK